MVARSFGSDGRSSTEGSGETRRRDFSQSSSRQRSRRNIRVSLFLLFFLYPKVRECPAQFTDSSESRESSSEALRARHGRPQTRRDASLIDYGTCRCIAGTLSRFKVMTEERSVQEVAPAGRHGETSMMRRDSHQKERGDRVRPRS